MDDEAFFHGGFEVEYRALRDESLKRIELRQQTVSIALTIAGVFLGVGIGTRAVALVYPPLAFALAIGWLQNDLRIKEIGDYIRLNLESRTPNLHWETTMHARRTDRPYWRAVVMSHAGAILMAQVIAIGVGVSTIYGSPIEAGEIALLVVDVLSALAVLLWIIPKSRR